MLKLLRLTPAQWHLLIRADLATGITNVPEWMYLTDAEPEDVIILGADSLIRATTADGTPTAVMFIRNRPAPDMHIHLTTKGTEQVRKHSYPQYRILRYLDNFRHIQIPLKHLYKTTNDLDNLRALDELGLIEVITRTGGQPRTVPLASIRVSQLTGEEGRQPMWLVSSTAAGRPYAAGEDLF